MNQKPTTKGKKMNAENKTGKSILAEIECNIDRIRLGEAQYKNGNPAKPITGEPWKRCVLIAEETKPLVVQAQAEHAALLAVAKLAKPLAALEISVCPHCDGNGLQYPEPNKDACHTCGGTGEIASPALPQDVKELQQALATLAQIQKGE